MDLYARAPGLIPCIAFLTLFSVLEIYVNYDETAIPGIESAQGDSESLRRRLLGLVYEAVPHPSRSDCVNLPPDCGPYAVRTVPQLPLKLYFWGYW